VKYTENKCDIMSCELCRTIRASTLSAANKTTPISYLLNIIRSKKYILLE